jgi:hypothetical protein
VVAAGVRLAHGREKELHMAKKRRRVISRFNWPLWSALQVRAILPSDPAKATVILKIAQEIVDKIRSRQPQTRSRKALRS